MPAKVKGAHHRGSYQYLARRVVAAANANPDTRCWRDGLTLAEHPPHKSGRPAYWQAGHIVDGQVGGPLAPEASVCNLSEGAKYGNRLRKPKPWTSQAW